MSPGETAVRWNDCPKCKGRGYFLKDPFIVDWNALAAPSNIEPCQTCAAAKAHFDTKGTMEGFNP